VTILAAARQATKIAKYSYNNNNENAYYFNRYTDNFSKDLYECG